MADVDAATLAGKAVRLGLITSPQVQDAWDELGSRNAAPEDFLRCLERKGALTPFQSSKLMKGDDDGYVLGHAELCSRDLPHSADRCTRKGRPARA